MFLREWDVPSGERQSYNPGYVEIYAALLDAAYRTHLGASPTSPSAYEPCFAHTDVKPEMYMTDGNEEVLMYIPSPSSPMPTWKPSKVPFRDLPSST